MTQPQNHMGTQVSENTAPFPKYLGPVLIVMGLIALSIGGITIFLYIRQFSGGLSEDYMRWSGFGDYIGGVLGSFFAFLGLIALLLTLWIQTEELRVSTGELRRSAEALAEQNKSLQLQNFEDRFFKMVSLHHEIVRGMDLRRGGDVTTSGRDCLKVFYERLMTKLEAAKRGDELNYKDGLLAGYESFYDDHSHELGHYFRNIYRIMKFINESGVSNKSEYSGILRAQLSNPELALLFYNGLSRRGDKLKPLAETYALFENLEPSQLIKKAEDSKFYDRNAFGEHLGLFTKENVG